MSTPIQDEPESTVGRKPEAAEQPNPPAHATRRAGVAIRREEGDETEFAGEIRERERDEPPTDRDVE